MEREKIYDKLEQLLNILKKVYADYKNIDTWAETKVFMDDIYDVYLALKTNSSITKDSKFQNFICHSTNDLIWFTNYINGFIFEMEETLSSTFYNDEWISICQQRSSIEAIKEIYTPLEEHLTKFLDIVSLDERIKVRGKIEGHIPQELIPKGIPLSHWWWWYPDTPSRNSSVSEFN